MSLTTTIESTFRADLQRLEYANQQIEQKHREIHTRTTARILALEREIVHVQTGRLQSGLSIEGPFPIGVGTLESRIGAPSVPYADDEALRGGAHDYPGRTVYEAQKIIAEALREMEVATIELTAGTRP